MFGEKAANNLWEKIKIQNNPKNKSLKKSKNRNNYSQIIILKLSIKFISRR